MGKKVRLTMLAMVLTLGIFGIVHTANANPTYLSQFNSTYGTSVSCTFCHTSPPALNATGTKFKNSGFNVASIAPVPTVAAFSIPVTSTSLTVTITTFTATDNVPVTGYMVTESTTPPSASATGWSASAPPNYTFATAGTKTLYAWAKDGANVVSPSVSGSTTITLPPAPDTIPPTVDSFTIPSTSSSLTVPISSLSATDNVAVAGYLVTESASTPSASASGWVTSPPSNYIFTTAGTKTLYAWAKDAANNVSASKSASTTITLPPVGDTTPPTVTGFALPPTSTTLNVPYTITATDNAGGTGVVGYLVKESPTPPPASSDPGWSTSSSGIYPFATSGSKTLYAWAKDAAGNVSTGLTATVTITLPDSTAAPDMTIWVGKWFKLTTNITGSCSGSSGIVSDSGSYVGYLKLWEWDPNNKILQGDLYEYDTATAQWSSQSLPLLFIGGSDLDFLCQSQVTDNGANSTEGFTARIVGKETAGILKSATFKSLGGYYIDALDQSGAIANCAGALKITGALIPESKVPVPIEVILH